MTDYVVLAFAVFRLTRLVTTDLIFNSVRAKIWKKYPPGGDGIGYLISCNWCTSLWISTPVFVMYKIWPTPTLFVCGILAVAAGAGILSRVN